MEEDILISHEVQCKKGGREGGKEREREKEYSSFSISQVHGGSRILFLDGGGIRGLIQIEVMSIIEQRTGRTITELFDWIVGTSTGGIVALGLVYGKASKE